MTLSSNTINTQSGLTTRSFFGVVLYVCVCVYVFPCFFFLVCVAWLRDSWWTWCCAQKSSETMVFLHAHRAVLFFMPYDFHLFLFLSSFFFPILRRSLLRFPISRVQWLLYLLIYRSLSLYLSSSLTLSLSLSRSAFYFFSLVSTMFNLLMHISKTHMCVCVCHVFTWFLLH